MCSFLLRPTRAQYQMLAMVCIAFDMGLDKASIQLAIRTRVMPMFLALDLSMWAVRGIRCFAGPEFKYRVRDPH